MICRRCGAEIPDWFIICGICGTPVFRLTGKEENSENGPGETPKIRVGETNAWNTGAGGRIQYGRGPEMYTDPEEEQRVRSRFAGLSFLVSIVSIMSLSFPYVTTPLSVMAILFGVISLRRQEYARKRAITGIVIGAVTFLLGATLTICMVILMPYAEDLMSIFQNYMGQMK